MRVKFPNTNITMEAGMASKCQLLANKMDIKHASQSKGRIAALALPKGIAKAAVKTSLICLAAIVDRFVSVIQTCGNKEVPASLKARKCILLPVKVAALAIAFALNTALLPLTAVAYTLQALLMLNKNVKVNYLYAKFLQNNNQLNELNQGL